MRRRRLARTGLVVALVAAGAAAAGASSGTHLIRTVSLQRQAAAIPSSLRERADWSRACAAHNNYMRLNGLTHVEQRGRPGYSSAGAWAGLRAVIGFGRLPGPTIWEEAPIHLTQILHPRLSVTGGAVSDGYYCFITVAGYARRAPRTARIYTYPANNATGVPTAQRYDSDLRLLGVSGVGTVVGEPLIVLPDAPGGIVRKSRIRSASLAPAGATPVALKRATSTILYGGAVLVPVTPLQPATTYRARVTLRYGSRTLSKSWRFTTR